MKKLFVCTLAVALVWAFTAPLMAADWNFYGSARMKTYSVDVDTKVAGVESDTDTTWDLQTNSRLGANVAAGDVSGRFEYGHAAGAPTLRLLYGAWNFGAGTLIVGQDYTPMTYFYSNQVYGADDGLLGYGVQYAGRVPQIALKFGGFHIAFMTPGANAAVMSSIGTTPPTAADVDTVMPRIEMAYMFKTDMFHIKPWIGWQSVDANGLAAGVDQSVDSLVYGIGGKVNFGPGWVGLTISGGTNAGNYGMAAGTEAKAAFDGATLQDNTMLQYALVAGFTINDMFGLEAGYGAISTEIDAAGVKYEDTAASYYLQAPITLAPGVFIVPEFGMIGGGETTIAGVATDNTETTYFGAKWQINF